MAASQGVVKFAQVVGVFPGPKFDDAEGHSWDPLNGKSSGFRRVHIGVGIVYECISLHDANCN